MHIAIVTKAQIYSKIFANKFCLLIVILFIEVENNSRIILKYANIAITVISITNSRIIIQIIFPLAIPENKYNFAKKPLVGGNPASPNKQVASADVKYGCFLNNPLESSILSV